MRPSPSGEQHEIRRGDQVATIVEVGGGIRRYAVGDRDVLEPYGADQMCDGAHGAPLIPWPNRLADGRYGFDGAEHQVALTEPEKHNAIHGLLRWRPWRCRERGADHVTMGTTLFPQKGYPFLLDVEVEYRLTDAGLSVSTTTSNIGTAAAPYGCGQHPYLSPGGGRVDDCILQLDADTRIVTDPDRKLPTGLEPVAGTDFDFRGGRRVGAVEVDYGFTDLHRDADGLAWVHLTGPDQHTARLWVDPTFPIIEIYTGDTLAPGRRRRGLGTEPMTCPPNAFQTGDGVIRLEPGEAATSSWGVFLTPPAR